MERSPPVAHDDLGTVFDRYRTAPVAVLAARYTPGSEAAIIAALHDNPNVRGLAVAAGCVRWRYADRGDWTTARLRLGDWVVVADGNPAVYPHTAFTATFRGDTGGPIDDGS